MSILDIILIIPIIWLAWRGYRKGLIMSITSLVALIAGIYFSIHFSGWVAEWLRNGLGFNGQYMNIISFVVVFVAVVVVIQIIGRFFSKLADWVALGAVNQIAGLLLGVAKATLFLGILLFIINSFDIENKLFNDTTRQESHLYEPLSSVVPFLWPRVMGWLPESMDEKRETIPRISV
jgi:membrane protein required for colicin V production